MRRKATTRWRKCQLSEMAKYNHWRGSAGLVPLFKGRPGSVPTCARRTRWAITLHLQPARRLVWSPLRASSDHRFIVGALRAQRPCQLSRRSPSKLSRYTLQRVAWVVASTARVETRDLLCRSLHHHTLFAQGSQPDCPSLRASDEHSVIVRVLRARRMVWRLPSHLRGRAFREQRR